MFYLQSLIYAVPCSKAWGANDDSRELSLGCGDGDFERFSDGASCCLS